MNGIVYRVLDNGLRVVIAPNRTTPVVTVGVGYKVGSKDEPADHTGMAHLFEHLMFDNIEVTDDKRFDSYVTQAGGESNAYTNYDHTYYHISLPSESLEIALWLEMQRMAEFVVPEQALRTQIDVVSEEILQVVENRPYGTWERLLNSRAFREKTMYSWEIIGSHEHVRSTTMDDARTWFSSRYNPDNAVIVLAGDVDPVCGAELVERYFGSISRRTATSTGLRFSAENRNVGHARETQDVPFDACFLAYHCEGFLNDETMIADVLSAILSDGRSSRLYKALQHDAQLASDFGAHADKREFTSLFTLYAISCDPSIDADKLHSVFANEIHHIVDKGVLHVEVAKAKNILKTRLAYQLQTSGGVADMLTQQVLFWNDPERIHLLMKKIEKLTVDEVNDFARKIFVGDGVRLDICAGERRD